MLKKHMRQSFFNNSQANVLNVMSQWNAQVS